MKTNGDSAWKLSEENKSNVSIICVVVLKDFSSRPCTPARRRASSRSVLGMGKILHL